MIARPFLARPGGDRVDIEVFNLEIYVHIVRPSLLESGVNSIAESRVVDGVNVVTVPVDKRSGIAGHDSGDASPFNPHFPDKPMAMNVILV